MPKSEGFRAMPRPVRVVLVGLLIAAFGSGSTVPYLYAFIVHLGLDARAAGILLTARAVGAVLGAVLGGAWADRVGAGRAAFQAAVVACGTTLALLLIREPWTGAALFTLYGAVGAMLQTALAAWLAQQTTPTQRTSAFGIQYVMVNVGGAGGALVAGMVLKAWPTSGYTFLYVADAISIALFALAVWPRGATRSQLPTSPQSASTAERKGYSEVVRDPAARWLCLTVAIVVAAGFSQLHVGLPVLALASGLSAGDLGWAFAANMLAVVILQAPVRRLTVSWRRTSSMFSGIAVMMAAWTVLAVATTLTAVHLVMVAVVFAAGEVLMAPVMSALVNDLAPDGLRGRYNGAITLAWTGGWLGGTAFTGAAVAINAAELLAPVFISLLGLGLAVSLRMRQHLPVLADDPFRTTAT
ncbi:MFS transporter [Kribbella sp. NPDC023855]|uniref:MFS transporter n=1 Tax=Kribbella sp. NPDC023855 TaxID=3154698 RepID=UPI0033D8CF1B